MFHDLGFYSGPDDEFADVPSSDNRGSAPIGEPPFRRGGVCGRMFLVHGRNVRERRESGSSRRHDGGYAGGTVANPKYLQVCKGGTGHKEVVRVLYDKNKISYKELLFLYFRQIDPTREDGMFLDGGEQYESHIRQQRQAKKRSIGGDRSDGKIKRV